MREAFPELHARHRPWPNGAVGRVVDQAALYSVLDRLQALGLDLVDVSVEGDPA